MDSWKIILFGLLGNTYTDVAWYVFQFLDEVIKEFVDAGISIKEVDNGVYRPHDVTNDSLDE